MRLGAVRHSIVSIPRAFVRALTHRFLWLMVAPAILRPLAVKNRFISQLQLFPAEVYSSPLT